MELTTFRDQLFSEGETYGFTDMELYYEKTDSLRCQVFEGEVDGYESATVSGVSLRGLYKGKMGYAYTEKLEEDSIPYLLDNAKENAVLMESDPEALFSGSDHYEKLDLYTDALDDVQPEAIISFLKRVEEKANAFDPRVRHTEMTIMERKTFEKGLYNNRGLALSERNNFLLTLVSVSVEDSGELKSGMQFKISKDFAEMDADRLAKEAVEKALYALGGKVYPNKNYPVVFENNAAATFLATFASSFSAEAVQKEQSRLKGRLNDQIASDIVTLIDNPFLPEGIASRTFDAEGVPTSKCKVVDHGRLTTFFHNQQTAKKDGVSSTGHGGRHSYKGALQVSPSNFFVDPGKESFEALYSSMDEGIIITDLAGMHSGADPISGDFSLAADGFYVKDGKIVGPTNLMTVAGNFFDVLKDVIHVGNDLTFSPMSMNGYIGSPSLKIKQLSIAVD